MVDFKRLKVVDSYDLLPTGHDKLFWVSEGEIISPIFDGFNAACRFRYHDKYAFEDEMCCLYRMPFMYSTLCTKVTV